MNRLSKFLLGFTALLSIGAISYAQVPGVNSNFPTYFHQGWEPSTSKATFSTSVYLTPASSATDIMELVGSATKTIRIRRVLINGIATTSVNAPVLIVKRVARDDGNAAIVPITAYDTNSPTGQNTATAVVEKYTANPTEPSSAANTIIIAERFVLLGNLTTATSQFWDMFFGTQGSNIILRGTSETLAINLDTRTYAGATINVVVEWTEE